ncbi:hypothetical protein SDC9_130833 [bioreactor metagenome]|uniref:Uncharacterized protein n=1 Tax=bioreactor metagenome TaxID=1076179 RepID=A0A645D395_9ZZZZ
MFVASATLPSRNTGVTQASALPILNPLSLSPFCIARVTIHSFSRNSGMVRIISTLFRHPSTKGIGRDFA